MGGGEEGEEGKADEEGFDDGGAVEGIEEGAGAEEEHRQRNGEGAGFGFQRGVAVEEEPSDNEAQAEDAEREGAGGGEGDSRDAEDEVLQRRPDGEGDRGVEVALPVPVAEEDLANGGVAVPAFVGVFGPVVPGGAVGEVGAEVEEVEREEDGREREEEPAEDGREVRGRLGCGLGHGSRSGYVGCDAGGRGFHGRWRESESEGEEDADFDDAAEGEPQTNEDR